MSIMKKLESARSQLMKSLNEIPIKWGRYINQDMQEEKVIFFGHEKAIYGSDGEMLDEKLVKIKGDISDEFSEEKSYEINNYCIYQNRLYRFTSPHSPGPFDGTHVVPVSISQEIAEVREGVEGIEGRMYPNNIGTDDIYAYAQGLPTGFYPVSTSNSTVNGPGVGCTGYIEKRNSSTIAILLISPSNGTTYTNVYNNAWRGWEEMENKSSSRNYIITDREGKYDNNPVGMLRAKWSELPMYEFRLLQLRCGSWYPAAFYRIISNGVEYGIAIIFSYNKAFLPRYIVVAQGTWNVYAFNTSAAS